MLKMYHNLAHAGSTPDFWEDNWENSHFEEAVKFCPIDPLRPLFEKYSRPGSLMLEGGCGMGQYLAYYGAQGRRVVGLDFALNTLKDLHRRHGDLPLACGNVSQMPFPDETFDLYYSGGVVEHFEAGAEDSLKEARRVLKKDGILLISVPYFSPLRKMLRPFKKNEWRTVETSTPDTAEVFSGRKFFQYAYTKKEFEKMLTDAGLRVKETVAYSVTWGLYDIPFLTPEPPQGEEIKAAEDAPPFDVKGMIDNEQPRSLLKRLAVSEDASVPVAGSVVKFMRWSSANLMMYVCTRG